MVFENDSSVVKEDTISDRALMELFKFKHEADYDTKTELTQNQIIDISKAVAYSKIFNLPMLKAFVDSYKLHMVSKNRLGRREVIEAVKQREMEDSEESKRNVSARLKSLVGL